MGQVRVARTDFLREAAGFGAMTGEAPLLRRVVALMEKATPRDPEAFRDAALAAMTLDLGHC